MSTIKDWRRWALRLAALTALAALLAAHGAMLYEVVSRAAIPTATLLSGMVVVIALKHLGLLGAFVAAIKRRFF